MTVAPTYLKDLELQNGLVPTQASEILYQVLPDFEEAFAQPSELVAKLWSRSAPILGGGQNSIRGELFELIIAIALVKFGLRPFYYQVKLALIPETDYDFVIWTRSGPVVISAKTSLRERIKQAALEAVALKMVHRRASSYVLTLDHIEAENANRKVMAGDLPALTAVIKADTFEFDQLCQRLGEVEIIEGPTVALVAKSRAAVK